MFITFYKTFRERPEEYQLTFEDFLNGMEFPTQPWIPEEVTIPFTVERDKEGLRQFFTRDNKNAWYELPRLPNFPSVRGTIALFTFRRNQEAGEK